MEKIIYDLVRFGSRTSCIFGFNKCFEIWGLKQCLIRNEKDLLTVTVCFEMLNYIWSKVYDGGMSSRGHDLWWILELDPGNPELLISYPVLRMHTPLTVLRMRAIFKDTAVGEQRVVETIWLCIWLNPVKA